MDPAAIERGFFAVVDAALAAAGCGRADVGVVSLTSQAQTFCMCDAQGRALSPFYGWTDARAGQEAAWLSSRLGDGFHATTGFPGPGPLLTISKVRWWLERFPDHRNARVTFLPSYLAGKLGAPHAIDRNLAAMSGMYSIPGRAWWNSALEVLGMDASQLGAVVDPGEILPEGGAARASGFPKSLRVTFAGNDHTAGAVACGCDSDRWILTLGTAGVVYRHAGLQPGPYAGNGIWGPFPGRGFYELLCLDHACSALDWADKTLFGRVDTPKFAQEASKALLREHAPLFDPMQWGNSVAWSGEGDAPTLAAAVLEGIAFALLSLIPPSLPVPQTLAILGGGSQCDLWVQLLADAFQRRIERPGVDGLDGAARLAGCPVARTIPPAGVFEPTRANREILESRRRLWVQRFRP